jgi:hypothetical protein
MKTITHQDIDEANFINLLLYLRSISVGLQIYITRTVQQATRICLHCYCLNKVAAYN